MKASNGKKRIFIGLTCLICLIPLLSMPFAGHQEAESADTVTSFPDLMDEGRLNTDFLSQAGDYFADNFGFRQNLVTANAAIQAGVFHTSSQENVLVGKEGWLYYGSTLDDYLGNPTLSDRQLSNLAYNMRLMQDRLEEAGIDFVFTVAPNKNSLYPQYMPDKFRTNGDGKNITRLVPYLQAQGVRYVDLYPLFGDREEVLYHQTDSHWNNQGAAMVNAALLSELGREYTDYRDIQYEVRNDFSGDLYGMLYPRGSKKDAQIYYDREPGYHYVEEIESTYDPEILTENPDKEGSLVMFRDSFGNSLLPFTADDFGQGLFSRSVPFQAFRAINRNADVMIAEVVERHLDRLAAQAPILPAADQVDLYAPDERDANYRASAEVEEYTYYEDDMEGMYYKISGLRDPAYDGDLSAPAGEAATYVYLYHTEEALGYLFPAYRTDGLEATADGEGTDAGHGFCAYINPDDLLSGHYTVALMEQTGQDDLLSQPLTELDVP